MSIIKLKLKERINKSHKIYIEEGMLDKIPEILKDMKFGEKYAIITDSVVEKLIGNTLLKKLNKCSLKAKIISFKNGELSKNLSTIEYLAEQMIKNGFDKKDAIIALGGGVVGDIAGFLASIYMRGIPYVHIPTTLLAMVDSSIGGKTGVDIPSGKNLIGTTLQPSAIFMDIDFLKNLPEKQIKNGLAEVIKYGVIKDKRLFKFVERNLEDILNKEPYALKEILTRSIKIKVKVVKKDEKEQKGIREILNYGHTYGHALEKLSGYKLLHGFAISVGMVLINKIAVQKGILKEKEAERIKNLLKKAGLPVTTAKSITKKDLLSDKKKEGSYIKLILAKRIGKVITYKEKCL